MNKQIHSAASVWKLRFTKPDGTIEDWGAVWMSDSELNSAYKWSAKHRAWINRKDPTKSVQALEV